jgi:hypothetical protein
MAYARAQQDQARERSSNQLALALYAEFVAMPSCQRNPRAAAGTLVLSLESSTGRKKRVARDCESGPAPTRGTPVDAILVSG